VILATPLDRDFSRYLLVSHIPAIEITKNVLSYQFQAAYRLERKFAGTIAEGVVLNAQSVEHCQI
jgi:hypothetical protein